MKQINPITLKQINQISTEMLNQKNTQNRLINQCKDPSTSDQEREMYDKLIKASGKRFMKFQEDLFNAIYQILEEQK